MTQERIARRSGLRTCLLVALGGAIGALCRHAVSVAVESGDMHTAIGTFVANVSGAFLLGFFMTFTARRVPVSLDARRFVAVGVLGSYTTSSTLSHQIWELIEDGNLAAASANAAGSLIAGLLAVAAGVALARRIS